MKQEFSQMAFNFPMEAEPQAPPKNGLSTHQGEENNALVLSAEEEHAVREEGRRAGVVVRIKSLKRSSDQTADSVTGTGILEKSQPPVTPVLAPQLKSPERVFTQTSIPLQEIALPIVNAEISEIPAPIEAGPQLVLAEKVEEMALAKEASEQAPTEKAEEPTLVEEALAPALVEDEPEPALVEQASEPTLAEETVEPTLVEDASPLLEKASEPALVQEASQTILAEEAAEQALVEETLPPLPKRSRPAAAEKAKPAPEKTKSKRGRKSLKEVAAEADLIDIPADEVLFSKQYYTMGEVAEMFRVNQSLLRFWETEFSILQPRKNRKGDRYFRPIDIKNLHLIYHLLRQRKYTIEGAKEFLRKNKKAEQRFEAIQRLQQIKAFLLELKAQL